MHGNTNIKIMLVLGTNALMIHNASIHRLEAKKDTSHYSEISVVTYLFSHTAWSM